MRSRWRENVSKKGRIEGNLHLTIDGDRDGDPHWSTDWAPKVQMRSRRRENMKKEIKTVWGVFTLWYKGTDQMRAHQGQLDWDWTRCDQTGVSKCDWHGGWLRSHLQWHWVLFRMHVLSAWDPCLFGCSPSFTWKEGGGTWTSHRAGNPYCS